MPRSRSIVGAALAAILASSLAYIARKRSRKCRLLRSGHLGGPTSFSCTRRSVDVARSGGVASRLTAHEGLEPSRSSRPMARRWPSPRVRRQPRRLHGARRGWRADAASHTTRSRIRSRSGTRTASRSGCGRWPRRRSCVLAFLRDSGGRRLPGTPAAAVGATRLLAGWQVIAYVSPTYDNRTGSATRAATRRRSGLTTFAHNTSEKITDWEGSDEWRCGSRPPLFTARIATAAAQHLGYDTVPRRIAR